jgi:DNA-binding transcriptional LysR family regulator
MDLDDLRIFRAVVREGGITRAALRLHRVQSNVTTRVQQLEATLGVQLFLREGRRLELSPPGRVLLDYAERLLDLAEEARAAVTAGKPCGRLRLGAMESTAAARLPARLAEFHSRYPEVQLELRTSPTGALLLELLDGRLDCALVSGPVDDARLETVPVYREEMVIVAPAKHPPIRSAKDVRARTLLTFAPGCAYRQRLEAWLAAAGVVPERVVELSSYHAMLGCVASGMGIALVPQSLLALQADGAAISSHRLPARFAQATTVLARRRGVPSPAVSALEELLRADAPEVARHVA